LVNEDRKIVLRLDWVRVDADGIAPVTRLYQRPVLGYRKVADRTRRALTSVPGITPTEQDAVTTVLHRIDRVPARPTPALDPEQTAASAVALRLHGYAVTVQETVEGTIADHDTEFLHDLRVAVRRTRSLLAQAGGELPVPARSLARFRNGFTWVGGMTSPVRDLDVYLLEMDALARTLVAADPGDLDPFVEYLERRRQRDRRLLIRGLRSARFTRLIEDWRAVLAGVIVGDDTRGTGTPRGEALTAGQLATSCTVRSARRVHRRARRITPASPADQVHALRKRSKELRYVLEAFRPVYPEGPYRAVIRDLRRVQDVLGAFQDGEVQSAGVREFAAEMFREGTAPVRTLMAMGELSAHLTRQQQRAREDLDHVLRRYLRPVTAEHLAALEVRP
jgi:CHAD domain-containing protein